MDIKAEINWIHQEIDKVKDPSFYNLDIESALENIKKGNFYTEDQAKEIAEKWGRK